MPRKLKFIICSPGGNITGLIIGRVPFQKQAYLARQLMKKFKEVEQVGYVTKTKKPSLLAGLQMMGGEFCGNAARSLAYIITKGIVPFVSPPKLPALFNIEVSGASNPIGCVVSERAVQIKIPLPTLTPIYQVCGKYHIIHLEGISYVLSEHRRGNAWQAHKILNTRDFKPLKAVGVVYYKRKSGNIFNMESYVLVKKTQSFILETSSSTSAIAIVIKETYLKKKKVYPCTYTIIPPSGIPLKAVIYRKEDLIRGAYIKGPVKLLRIESIAVN